MKENIKLCTWLRKRWNFEGWEWNIVDIWHQQRIWHAQHILQKLEQKKSKKIKTVKLTVVNEVTVEVFPLNQQIAHNLSNLLQAMSVEVSQFISTAYIRDTNQIQKLLKSVDIMATGRQGLTHCSMLCSASAESYLIAPGARRTTAGDDRTVNYATCLYITAQNRSFLSVRQLAEVVDKNAGTC